MIMSFGSRFVVRYCYRLLFTHCLVFQIFATVDKCLIKSGVSQTQKIMICHRLATSGGDSRSLQHILSSLH
ncbi:hypothetical protein TNCT_278141 [Trichonephila clavata]|uniref:Uncharacterized protein n=1 Tax=Trichonephila clavata TaxID=2740835 RepID=A0A8X6G7B2_TRICU|nr:hypothetical protein TNCT_278141 [Trichonephila clavata]